ncbi:MAG TPA: HAMP domain-containing sensor histidine kinase [Anaeromyxobacteraceae bacterium]|nr:HAMP domain-containing sensor histidine kinase [Anaeromyxobacteraceae bacterium]
MLLAGDLVTSQQSVPAAMTVRQVADRFFQEPELEAVALLEGDRARGLVTRPKLLLKLLRNFGYELFARRPVLRVANPEPLRVEATAPLAEVVERALSRPRAVVYDEVVVEEDGRFRGLISVRDLALQQSEALAASLAQREVATARAAELEREGAMRTRFLAHVTHELRSPVNAIIGLAEIARRASAKGQAEAVEERLALLVSSAAALRGIVGNVLDLSKMDAGKMELVPERFDLSALAAELGATARVLAGQKPVEVDVELPPEPLVIRSDPQKVRQIVLNLAGNAVKFTDRGRVVLALSRSGDGAVLAVRDSGIGIRPDDLARLFVPFRQCEDARVRRHEGTGLGLAIARSMAELLGGQLTAESVHGRGSVFTLTIPPIPERSA